MLSSLYHNSYSCSSKEAATDLLAYVKTPHPWLLSGDEEYDRSHRDVSFIWKSSVSEFWLLLRNPVNAWIVLFVLWTEWLSALLRSRNRVIRWFFQARESFSEHGKSTCVINKSKTMSRRKMLWTFRNGCNSTAEAAAPHKRGEVGGGGKHHAAGMSFIGLPFPASGKININHLLGHFRTCRAAAKG